MTAENALSAAIWQVSWLYSVALQHHFTVTYIYKTYNIEWPDTTYSIAQHTYKAYMYETPAY